MEMLYLFVFTQFQAYGGFAFLLELP